MERIETLEALIDAYCQVWSEPDAQRREQGLARLWAASATYTDPTVDWLNGHALLQHIGRVQATRPGARAHGWCVVRASTPTTAACASASG